MKTATLVVALVASLFLASGAVVQAWGDWRELQKKPELASDEKHLLARTFEVLIVAMDLKVRYTIFLIGWGAVAIGSALAFVASLLALIGGS